MGRSAKVCREKLLGHRERRMAMSKLLGFYKQWTCKSEANERQRALIEAFLAEEGYVDHKI
ncbi:hypothetical protein Taro_046757 [Colocasia esculenta]|uniref:Uncharacterized protein n=1 Tax=Colocasia esculenta TaxID=4460 RepID=A0A843X2W5_COLES|nr:hypothetical protein [Colocasia esculenta]